MRERDHPAQPSAEDIDMTPKARETRARILEIALRLFREKGFDETTMRDIASEAGMATGAAYYYFKTKQDIVMAFYDDASSKLGAELPDRFGKLKDFQRRVQLVPELWLEHFAPHRAFLSALFRTAVDPDNPVSPFAAETRHIRQRAVGWFEQAIAGSSMDIPREFQLILPRLLWFYQMGIIMFWLYDSSPGQRRTHGLLSGGLELISMGIKLSGLPLMGKMRRKIVRVAMDAGIEDFV